MRNGCKLYCDGYNEYIDLEELNDKKKSVHDVIIKKKRCTYNYGSTNKNKTTKKIKKK